MALMGIGHLARFIHFKVGSSPHKISPSSSTALPQITYSDARAAKYHDVGRMEFDSRSKNPSDRRREIVTLWLGKGNKKAIGQYLWLVVGEPYPLAGGEGVRQVHL